MPGYSIVGDVNVLRLDSRLRGNDGSVCIFAANGGTQGSRG